MLASGIRVAKMATRFGEDSHGVLAKGKVPLPAEEVPTNITVTQPLAVMSGISSVA
jgi:hypothetical protein